MSHEKSQLEFKIRDLSRQLAGAEEDRDRVSAECQKMYANRGEIEEARLILERDLARNLAKNEALVQQLSDKDEVIFIYLLLLSLLLIDICTNQWYFVAFLLR